MRKYIILILPLLVLMFGFVSKADTYTAPNGQTYYVKYSLQNDFSYQDQHFKADYYTNQYIGIYNNLPYIWVNGARKQLNMSPYNAGTYTFINQAINVGQANASTSLLRYSSANNTYTTIDSCVYVQTGTTGITLQFNPGNYGYTSSTIPVFQNTSDLDSYISSSPIQVDWDHPYYSVAIPTPEYDVTYRKVGLDVDVPLNFNFNAPLDGEYYVEIMAEFALADYLTFMPVSRYFEASSYSYVTKEIVNPVQYVLASDLTANTLNSVLTNMWQAALNEVPLSNVSIKFPTDFSAQDILNWREAYDELRSTCGVAGTSIKFYARYFLIVDDTKFVVGPWRIWNSVSPKTFNDELPSYYLPYAIASGNTGTSTSTSSDPDDVYIPVGGDNPTGEYYSPSFNITVGNNVPNYPDYPTIASYNMDNLLVSTMNNAKGLSGFFGEFGGFLTASFAFIPSWIWAIIGVGFSLSIVVMFLKIL